VITAAEAQAIMDGNVRPFLEETSYGRPTITTTVSSAVYRLPDRRRLRDRDNETQLHTDAAILPAGEFTMANYDRIIASFPNAGTSLACLIPITFAGEANLGGPYVPLNGTFAWQTIAHELGHTYGLHANLACHRRNPLSPAGTTVEYGDPFDMMGSTSITGVTRDLRHHYNAGLKTALVGCRIPRSTRSRPAAPIESIASTTRTRRIQTARWHCGCFAMECAGIGFPIGKVCWVRRRRTALVIWNLAATDDPAV